MWRLFCKTVSGLPHAERRHSVHHCHYHRRSRDKKAPSRSFLLGSSSNFLRNFQLSTSSVSFPPFLSVFALLLGAFSGGSLDHYNSKSVVRYNHRNLVNFPISKKKFWILNLFACVRKLRVQLNLLVNQIEGKR